MSRHRKTLEWIVLLNPQGSNGFKIRQNVPKQNLTPSLLVTHVIWGVTPPKSLVLLGRDQNWAPSSYKTHTHMGFPCFSHASAIIILIFVSHANNSFVQKSSAYCVVICFWKSVVSDCVTDVGKLLANKCLISYTVESSYGVLISCSEAISALILPLQREQMPNEKDDIKSETSHSM